MDPAARTVTRAGEAVTLPPKAFDLLLSLIRREGRVASRVELLREVWGYGPLVLSRTVDSHVVELRRKLEPDPGQPAASAHRVQGPGTGSSASSTAHASRQQSGYDRHHIPCTTHGLRAPPLLEGGRASCPQASAPHLLSEVSMFGSSFFAAVSWRRCSSGGQQPERAAHHAGAARTSRSTIRSSCSCRSVPRMTTTAGHIPGARFITFDDIALRQGSDAATISNCRTARISARASRSSASRTTAGSS